MTEHANHTEHAQHIIPVRTYLVIFGILMGLLVATVIGAYIPIPESMGWMHLSVAMTIAVAKAALIVMYFMHVRFSNRLTWVFSTAAFFWLLILLVLCLADYHSRGWLDIEGK
jgi:cytochrome c oxidase subunit 4